MGYSGLSITNSFKTILSDGRKPKKVLVERSSELYKKRFKLYLKNMKLNFILYIVI